MNAYKPTALPLTAHEKRSRTRHRTQGASVATILVAVIVGVLKAKGWL